MITVPVLLPVMFAEVTPLATVLFDSLADMSVASVPRRSPALVVSANPDGTFDLRRGGVPAGTTTATVSDPALAAELQKLDQVRAKDSPVLLFQLMQQQDGAKAPVRKDRNW